MLPLDAFPGTRRYATAWNSYGASIPALAAVAPAGFLNVLIDPHTDGVVRAAPLIARYEPGEGASQLRRATTSPWAWLSTAGRQVPPHPIHD